MEANDRTDRTASGWVIVGPGSADTLLAQDTDHVVRESLVDGSRVPVELLGDASQGLAASMQGSVVAALGPDRLNVALVSRSGAIIPFTSDNDVHGDSRLAAVREVRDPSTSRLIAVQALLSRQDAHCVRVLSDKGHLQSITHSGSIRDGADTSDGFLVIDHHGSVRGAPEWLSSHTASGEQWAHVDAVEADGDGIAVLASAGTPSLVRWVSFQQGAEAVIEFHADAPALQLVRAGMRQAALYLGWATRLTRIGEIDARDRQATEVEQEALRRSSGPIDVFLSYKDRESHEKAAEMHRRLKARGLQVFLDKDSIHGDWERAIKDALRRTRVLVVVWSDGTAGDGIQRKELRHWCYLTDPDQPQGEWGSRRRMGLIFNTLEAPDAREAEAQVRRHLTGELESLARYHIERPDLRVSDFCAVVEEEVRKIRRAEEASQRSSGGG